MKQFHLSLYSYPTSELLGPASYEQLEKYLACLENGKTFFTEDRFGFPHKLTVVPGKAVTPH